VVKDQTTHRDFLDPSRFLATSLFIVPLRDSNQKMLRGVMMSQGYLEVVFGSRALEMLTKWFSSTRPFTRLSPEVTQTRYKDAKPK
jgi:hypothetical protein